MGLASIDMRSRNEFPHRIGPLFRGEICIARDTRQHIKIKRLNRNSFISVIRIHCMFY